MPARPNTRRRPRPPGSTLRREPQSADERALDAFMWSRPWRLLRAAYLAERPLCERCRAEGRFTAATVVHHKVDRRERPDLALEWSNLEALDRECHNAESARRQARPCPA